MRSNILVLLIITALIGVVTPAHSAAQPALQAQWIQPGIIGLHASQAGCIIAQPSGTLVTCDYSGGPWYVLIGAYADQDYSPRVPGRWYTLWGFSDAAQQYQTLGSVDVPPYAQVILPLVVGP